MTHTWLFMFVFAFGGVDSFTHKIEIYNFGTTSDHFFDSNASNLLPNSLNRPSIVHISNGTFYIQIIHSKVGAKFTTQLQKKNI